MKQTVDVKWLDGMAFEAEVDGHRIALDASPETGSRNSGPRPKPLMMVALAGCTGMDVISILKKMKVEPQSFIVRVEGESAEEHPKQYTSMHLIYEFRGEGLQVDKLQRAIELSQEKYCGVSATLKKALDITYEIRIV